MCVIMYVNLSSGSRKRDFKSALNLYHAIGIWKKINISLFENTSRKKVIIQNVNVCFGFLKSLLFLRYHGHPRKKVQLL